QTISRRRRRTRLRSTALPTWRDTVKPTRAVPPSARQRACTRNAAAGARIAAAAARKSTRRFNRSMIRWAWFNGLGSTALIQQPWHIALGEMRRRVRFGPAASGHALRRLRPWERRAATTLRPPLVAIRARKPWRRLRTSLLG